MLQFPDIDPIAFEIGPLAVRWYGLMYLAGFVSAYAYLCREVKRNRLNLSCESLGDLLFAGVLGVVLGGRLGYVLFYNFAYYMRHPLEIFHIWEGGMSFHGGLAGVLIAAWLFARRHRLAYLQLTDFIAPLVPIGLGAGRLGNFINHELPGRASEVPWAMVFPPMLGLGPEPRHPSALYEFALEGVVLFAVLWWLSRKPQSQGLISGLFLLLYGTFRFIVEFARLPDPQLGFIAFGWLTMGQLLTVPMLAAGALLVITARRSQKTLVAATGR